MKIDPKKIARMITEDPDEVAPSDHFDDFEDEYRDVNPWATIIQTRPAAESLATRMNEAGLQPGKEQDHPAYCNEFNSRWMRLTTAGPHLCWAMNNDTGPELGKAGPGSTGEQFMTQYPLSKEEFDGWVLWENNLESGVGNGTAIVWDGEEWTVGPDIES
tara:strand:+ start:254 stop:733 length:480 start_codon:yes stop_codon:yes gene_type:complete